jgi:hypothetical protein
VAVDLCAQNATKSNGTKHLRALHFVELIDSQFLIIFNSHFTLSRHVQALYWNRWLFPIGTMHVAATRIQAAFRGFLVRRRRGLLPWLRNATAAAGASAQTIGARRGGGSGGGRGDDDAVPMAVLAIRARRTRKAQRLRMPPALPHERVYNLRFLYNISAMQHFHSISAEACPQNAQVPATFLLLQYRQHQLLRSPLTPYLASQASRPTTASLSSASRLRDHPASLPPPSAAVARALGMKHLHSHTTAASSSAAADSSRASGGSGGSASTAPGAMDAFRGWASEQALRAQIVTTIASATPAAAAPSNGDDSASASAAAAAVEAAVAAGVHETVEFRAWAATRVQAWWRMIRARRTLKLKVH